LHPSGASGPGRAAAGHAGGIVMIAGLTHSGPIPTLERTVQFTSARHKVLTNNIANLSTPHFKPKELDPGQFQAQLREAVEARRDNPQAERTGGPLKVGDSDQLQFEKDGVNARPKPANDNIMFHDRNNRSLERQMQNLAENTLMHRTSITMLKNEFDLLNTAISERV
jgi:flagellar basal-body rod protein FlgB